MRAVEKSLQAHREEIEAELPQIELRETQLRADLHSSLQALVERRRSNAARLLALYPAIQEFVGEVQIAAEIQREIHQIFATASASGIAQSELADIDLTPPYRTSRASGGTDGSLIQGLRVPGLAPADAAEPPPWLYKPR